jgi:peroxiredoxin
MRGITPPFYTGDAMTTPQSHPRPSRRTVLGLAVPVVLLLAYWLVTSGVRAHVDGLIHQSIGKPLPAFRLVDEAGTEWSADSLRGKPAILHFFRSYCHTCDAEAPGLRQLEQRLPPDVQLLHVMTDVVMNVDPAVTAKTIASKAFQRPVVRADAGFVDAFHSVRWANVTPITYVVDAAGVIRYGLRGMQTPAAIEAAVAASR